MYLVLDSEDVRDFPPELITPQLRSARYVGQLGPDHENFVALINSSNHDGFDTYLARVRSLEPKSGSSTRSCGTCFSGSDGAVASIRNLAGLDTLKPQGVSGQRDVGHALACPSKLPTLVPNVIKAL